MSTKIGYVIVSHGEDFNLLDLTFNSSDIPESACAVIVWSPSKGITSDEAEEMKIRITAMGKAMNCSYFVATSTIPMTCLEARKFGFDKLKSMKDLEYVQFIDSGDFIGYVPEGHLSDEVDIYWSKVNVSEDDAIEMLSGDYSSFDCEDYGDRGNYTSCSYFNAPKEVYDKIMSVGKECKIHRFNSINTLIDNYYSPSGIDNVTFGMKCPSIVVMPWKVSLVKDVFDYMEKRGISIKVNMAEDMLFHTIARYLIKSNKGEIKCRILESYYTYVYYSDSLVHGKDNQEEKLIEVNRVRGICAQVLSGDSDTVLSCNDNNNKPTETPYIAEIDGEEYDIVEVSWKKDILLNEKMLCWYIDIGSVEGKLVEAFDKYQIHEVVAYIASRSNSHVIANNDVYCHCARILGKHKNSTESLEPTKERDTWMVLYNNGETCTNSEVLWNDKTDRMDDLFKQLEHLSGFQIDKIEITQMIKMSDIMREVTK